MNGNALNNKERQKKIIEYIIAHQGCNKEKAFKGVEKYMARVTFFNLIKELEEEGTIIEGEKEKPKSRDHKLFVNTNNLLVIVPNELEKFEKAFTLLLEKAKRESDYYIKKSELSTVYDIISQLLFIFYEMVNVYHLHSLISWPLMVLETDTLKKLYTIVFTKISDMQIRIYENLRSSKFSNANLMLQSTIIRKQLYSTDKLIKYCETFSKLGMKKQIESVLDCLWEIKASYIQDAYPEPWIYKWNFKKEDGWRKLIELQKQNPHQTYESYLNNYVNDTSGSNKKE
jgi:hypothetical protein